MKVVVNKCYGGFGISITALKELVLRKSDCITATTPKQYYGGNNENYKSRDKWKINWENDFKTYEDIGDGFMAHPQGYNIYKNDLIYDLDQYSDDNFRSDKDLVEVVEKLGTKANGFCADLQITEIPDDIKWSIHNYDGMEHVEEAHRTW